MAAKEKRAKCAQGKSANAALVKMHDGLCKMGMSGWFGNVHEREQCVLSADSCDAIADCYRAAPSQAIQSSETGVAQLKKRDFENVPWKTIVMWVAIIALARIVLPFLIALPFVILTIIAAVLV